MNHAELRLSLGAYLLGGLDLEEARAVEQHLASCPECRAEVEQLEILPALLDAVPVSRAEALAERPVAAAVAPAPPALLAKVRTRRRALRMRWAGAIAGAAAASLAVGIALGPVVGWAPPAPSGTPSPTAAPAASATLISADGTQVDVAFVRKGWGTELDLVCRGMPSAGVFSVWIVTADGAQERAASWSSTGYSGRAVLTGATSFQLASIRGVEVRDASQNTLARATVG
ncbi:zf-HC2 domain-containing protein [Sinomonas sp. JGH33]|uniref:Zf-HC2 domain-containing protein n=1 Tax=Sinomonas terricola TaxID=3110330 RepID=A0ABU5T2P7_9MICC|nr:zf-HC2 domain-containing protein [Sinomonas sp. JGH33]MEA5453937.1 zf-HC2 domain-containing protein [Sinomonas sp. JGH33]